ncbi:MAG: RnfABCDGE type electron transport complex subunit G [Bacteroidales bacterium]|nr:RnfABCDGE type electron transport complex subunit G [Bacteroidales bacterium]
MARESTFVNMSVTLFAVCLIASAVLGGVYALTKEPIDAAQIAKINGAIGGVVPEFDNAPSAEMFTVEVDGKKSNVYPAKKGEEIVGYAIEASSSKGFGGNITLMVGFKPDGSLVKTSVISHAETPGLGAKIDDSQSHFVTQFEGKNPADPNFKLSVKKDGGDIDAITASTITSRAYCDVIENAYKAFCEANKNNVKADAEQPVEEVQEAANASEEAQN